MTRVRLPPDPGNACVTTIVDSQGGDAYLMNSVSAAEQPQTSVDSIVLVYDLARPETFHRLERHWLPLIERCYKGKVRILSEIQPVACSCKYPWMEYQCYARFTHIFSVYSIDSCHRCRK